MQRGLSRLGCRLRERTLELILPAVRMRGLGRERHDRLYVIKTNFQERGSLNSYPGIKANRVRTVFDLLGSLMVPKEITY